MARSPLVIASGNAGKIREFAALLADLPLEIRAQPEDLEVEETGATFAENARLKATAVALASGCWALADDSGLAVAALAGAPGVHSARYAPTDAERIARLLRELEAAQHDHAVQGLEAGVLSTTVLSATGAGLLPCSSPGCGSCWPETAGLKPACSVALGRVLPRREGGSAAEGRPGLALSPHGPQQDGCTDGEP